MVRLEFEDFPKPKQPFRIDFNSSMVRLELVGTAGISVDTLFQFLNGAIRILKRQKVFHYHQ